ncbi:hypothetical protein [Marinactinospora rubrisoli]|uniref:Alpha-L-rhamnosidase six-hairpin glycosidase domain-containing protein n=1 Tax=Marinactinospora rubrisoli TaxID=2715399 RepID=A0ABW2KKP1_9ACTN
MPTDTPVYEKAGWTGDARLTATTASYEFGMSRFHREYLSDVLDSRLPSGELPATVPTSGWGYEGAPERPPHAYLPGGSGARSGHRLSRHGPPARRQGVRTGVPGRA